MRWVTAALLAIAAALVVESFTLTTPPSAADLAAQQEEFDGWTLLWEAEHEALYAGCLERRAEALEAGDDFFMDCEWINDPPVLPEWEPDVPFSELALAHLGLLGPLLAAGAFLVGASLVGAEIATGGLALLLTVETRRTRVLVTKLVSVGLTSLVLAGVSFGALVGAESAVAVAHGVLDRSPELWREIASAAARGIAFAVVAGVVGASLSALLRSTTGTLGALLGYVVGVELVVWSMLPSLQPWVVRPNVAAVVNGGSEVSWTRCGASPVDGARRCIEVVHVISTGAGAAYVGALAVVVVLATWFVFRRRDVS